MDETDRYVEVMVQQGARIATILSCQECGAIVIHRAVHDAWHATINERLLHGIGS